MEWQIIDSGTRSAEENMALDAGLLEGCEVPTLHFYEWTGKSATYGYFTDPRKVLSLSGLEKHGICIARRPTGGGVVFHFWDMAFSVVVPVGSPAFSENTLDNYRFVNRVVLEAVKSFLRPETAPSLTPEDLSSLDETCRYFCMAKPTKYDVVWEGKKIAGAAQRKTKQGFLHQGTIALCMPQKDVLEEILLPGTQVEQAMQTYTHALLGHDPRPEDVVAAKLKLKELLTVQFNSTIV